MVIDKVLTLRELEDVVGLRKTAIYSAMKTNEFPRPIKLTTRKSGWLKSEVQEWLELRRELRDRELEGTS